MRRKLIILLGMFVLVASVFASTGCGNQGQRKITIAQQRVVTQDILKVENQVRELRNNEALPQFHDSAALHVQDAYYTADADPNKTWYVTLVALDGTPYAHFTTRGAPQPAGDQVTNPVQLYCQRGARSAPGGCGTIGLPEPNGVHQGANNPGYVAILTTGAMIRLPENAVISDQPFSVSAPVKLSINENAQISHTDSSKTTGAIIPSGSGQRAGK